MTEHRIDAPAGWRELPDDDLAWLAIEHLVPVVCHTEDLEAILTAMTPGQRAVYCTHYCEADVTNGGFHQYLSNSTGDTAPEAIGGFRLLGMHQDADALKAALKFAGLQPFVRNREQRGAALPDHRQHRDEWEKLDMRASSDIDLLTKRQADYIRAHPDEFFVL
ncbi:MAG: DUF4375 domain-containing protein [Planctomycetes bacterium]|nr:DUF4375 domain-containing protein [Planctomycetota bacterium]